MWQAIGAGLKIALVLTVFFLKRYTDPRTIARKEEERSEEERQKFRKAVWSGDSDMVSRLLDARMRRLREKNRVSDGG